MNDSKTGRRTSLTKLNRFRISIVLPPLFVLFALPGAADATQWQSLDEVRSVAEAYARNGLGLDSSRTVKAGMLDRRLKLKNCSDALEAFLPPGTRNPRSMTIGVRCTGATPWKLFVPVRSELMGQVLASRHALARGHRIGPGDVEFVRQDLDRLPYGYLRDSAELNGKILRRPIAPGTILIPSMLDQGKTVRKGQTVTLYADHSGVRIQMAGKALMDAALQQRVRVENLSSGRVVEGVVRSAERVEILMN